MPKQKQEPRPLPLGKVPALPDGLVYRLWRVDPPTPPSCVECGAPTPFLTALLPAGHRPSDYHPPLLFIEHPATAGPQMVDPATAMHGSALVVLTETPEEYTAGRRRRR